MYFYTEMCLHLRSSYHTGWRLLGFFLWLFYFCLIHTDGHCLWAQQLDQQQHPAGDKGPAPAHLDTRTINVRTVFTWQHYLHYTACGDKPPPCLRGVRGSSCCQLPRFFWSAQVPSLSTGYYHPQEAAGVSFGTAAGTFRCFFAARVRCQFTLHARDTGRKASLRSATDMCPLYTHFVMNRGPHLRRCPPVASPSAGVVSAARSLVSTVGCVRGSVVPSLVSWAFCQTDQQVALHRIVRGEMTTEPVGGDLLFLINGVKVRKHMVQARSIKGCLFSCVFLVSHSVSFSFHFK